MNNEHVEAVSNKLKIKTTSLAYQLNQITNDDMSVLIITADKNNNLIIASNVNAFIIRGILKKATTKISKTITDDTRYI